jgi:hypothetical protein
MPADDGATMAFVVEYRGEQAVTATLDAISLANADPGLDVVETGILMDGYPFLYVSRSFPVGRMKPVAGTVITTAPGDPAGDTFFALGIRTNLKTGPQAARGVWLDYHIDSARYRAVLPWLLSVCPTPITAPCAGLPAQEFSFPPLQ